MKVQAILLWHYYLGDELANSTTAEFNGTLEELNALEAEYFKQNDTSNKKIILQQIVLINWEIEHR